MTKLIKFLVLCAIALSRGFNPCSIVYDKEYAFRPCAKLFAGNMPWNEQTQYLLFCIKTKILKTSTGAFCPVPCDDIGKYHPSYQNNETFERDGEVYWRYYNQSESKWIEYQLQPANDNGFQSDSQILERHETDCQVETTTQAPQTFEGFDTKTTINNSLGPKELGKLGFGAVVASGPATLATFVVCVIAIKAFQIIFAKSSEQIHNQTLSRWAGSLSDIQRAQNKFLEIHSQRYKNVQDTLVSDTIAKCEEIVKNAQQKALEREALEKLKQENLFPEIKQDPYKSNEDFVQPEKPEDTLEPEESEDSNPITEPLPEKPENNVETEELDDADPIVKEPIQEKPDSVETIETTKESITFGENPNSKFHTIRHVLKDTTISEGVAKNAIVDDLSKVGSRITRGNVYHGKINIEGTDLHYNAFRRVDTGIINVGKITIKSRPNTIVGGISKSKK